MCSILATLQSAMGNTTNTEGLET